MALRITIDDLGSVENNPFKQTPKKELGDLLPGSDPLRNFLENEVGVSESEDLYHDPKIPEDAPIKQAERVAKYRGGKVEDYLKLHPRDLWQLDMEVKREHPAEPIKQGQELRDNKFYREEYYQEQKDILNRKLPGTLY